jgi:hypothetical protein
VAGDVQRLKLANGAAIELVFQGTKVRIETPIERQKHARLRRFKMRRVRLRSREVEIDWLFAENSLAGLGCAQAEIEMCIG